MTDLYLLRHAKSSWAEASLADRERPLNRRGLRDAPRMGAALAGRVAPIGIYTSPARRARETLAGLCKGWPALSRQHHQVDEALYTFSSEDLLAWLARSPDADGRWLIGHNPALTDLVNLLCGGWQLDNLPTAGFAWLKLDIDCWRDIGPGCAILHASLFPKQLDSEADWPSLS
jgi:phosphohistidine phosphatase